MCSTYRSRRSSPQQAASIACMACAPQGNASRGWEGSDGLLPLQQQLLTKSTACDVACTGDPGPDRRILRRWGMWRIGAAACYTPTARLAQPTRLWQVCTGATSTLQALQAKGAATAVAGAHCGLQCSPLTHWTWHCSSHKHVL